MQLDVAKAELSGEGFTPNHHITAQGQIRANSSGQRNKKTPSLLISNESSEPAVISTMRKLMDMVQTVLFARM